MNPIRRTACYLTMVLLLNCAVQAELIWLEELLGRQLLPEQNTAGEFEVYRDTMEAVWEELVWFPVPDSSVSKEASVAFENSWMAERNYGGKRGHEGTDLMPSINKSGYYPVVSITDGVIEQAGWLEKEAGASACVPGTGITIIMRTCTPTSGNGPPETR